MATMPVNVTSDIGEGQKIVNTLSNAMVAELQLMAEGEWGGNIGMVLFSEG
eukprot:gene32008-4954_t